MVRVRDPRVVYFQDPAEGGFRDPQLARHRLASGWAVGLQEPRVVGFQISPLVRCQDPAAV